MTRADGRHEKAPLSRGFRFHGLTGLLRAERLAAAAAACGLGVRDREPGAAEVLDVIDLRLAQVGRALRIDDDLDAADLEQVVVVALLVELEPVLETRAPAALHEDPQRLPLGVG